MPAAVAGQRGAIRRIDLSTAVTVTGSGRNPGTDRCPTRRVAVPALRDPADHHTPHPGRELIIDRRADQLKPEQPDRLRLLQPDPVLLIGAAVTHPASP